MSSKHAIRPNTQKAIVDAAIDLLNANPGASMSEIALAAGIGRATLHRHFANREALISEIQLMCMAEMNDVVGAKVEAADSALAKLMGLFEAAIPMGDRFNFLSLEGGKDPQVHAGYIDQLRRVRELVAQLKAEGELDSAINDGWITAQIDQLIWIAWREVAAGRVAMADAPALAVRTLTRGLGK